MNTSFISILLFDSYRKMYRVPSDDPLFPASSRIMQPNSYDNRYYWSARQNNDPMPRILGCIDNASIWDPTTGEHWGHSAMASDGEIGFGFQNGETVYVISLLNIAKWAQNFSTYWNNTSIIPLKPTQRELVRTLLSRAIWKSSICNAYLNWRSLDLHTHFTGILSMYQPRWEAEVRHLFRTSLAQIQYSVLDTARGTEASLKVPDLPPGLAKFSRLTGGENSPNIPPGFEGICSIVKFNSNGWRNVSVWGFVGLLFLAAGIALGSCRTVEGKLFLIFGMETFYKVSQRLCSKMASLPWMKIWSTVVDARYQGSQWVQRVIRSLWTAKQNNGIRSSVEGA